ncbi:MAG: alpha/beta hydrolase [Gemmatimonas sp.]
MTSAAGLPYDISIAGPATTPPAHRFPVLFLLDADVMFATTVEIVRARSVRAESTGVVPAIVVGISFPESDAQKRGRRLGEFSFGPPADAEDATIGNARTGDGDQLRAFIEAELKPFVAQHYPVDGSRQCIIGHSMSAMFVLENLLRAPASFRHHVAISASVWWDFEPMYARARKVAFGASTGVHMFVGEYEETLAPWQQLRSAGDLAKIEARREKRRMIQRSASLAEVLQHGSEGPVRYTLLPEEDHLSVVPVAIGRVLREILAP